MLWPSLGLLALLAINASPVQATSCASSTAFSYTAAAEDSVTVSWDDPAGADTFTLTTNLDMDVPHPGLTSPQYTYTGLTAGIVYEMTATVVADCAGTASAPLLETVSVNTKPGAPVVEKSMDEDDEISLGMTQEEGSVDSYKVTVGGQTEVVEGHEYYKSGLKAGKTYTITVVGTLQGADGDETVLTHKVPPAETIIGLDPWIFAFLIIGLIILLVLIVVVVIVVIYCCVQRSRNKKKNALLRNGSGKRKGEDGYESDTNSEEQPWEYKDPYETADYRLTNTQKKRAFAIAAQRAAMTNNSVY
jgi:hypothetical protein